MEIRRDILADTIRRDSVQPEFIELGGCVLYLSKTGIGDTPFQVLIMMQRKFLLLFLWLLAAIGTTYAAKGKTTVTGKLTNFKGGVVSLSYQEYTLLSGLQKQEVEVGADG